MATNSSSYQQAALTLPDVELDDRLGIEIDGGNIYFAAFDKRTSKSILLLNEHDQIATPTTVAFLGDEVLVGESASKQLDTNAENTFRNIEQLLGERFDDQVAQQYSKNERHVLVQQNSRCLLHIPSRDKDVSPEELMALVITKVVQFATTKYNHDFRFASFALSFEELSSEKRVRAYAQVAGLSGLKNVRVILRAVGHVRNVIHDHAWYLQPKPGPFPVIVVDTDFSCPQVSLVVLNGRSTYVEGWMCSKKSRVVPAFDRIKEASLQRLGRCAGRQIVGVLFTGSWECKWHDKSLMLSMIRSALQEFSTSFEARELEYQERTACGGIVYDKDVPEPEDVVVGNPSYMVRMAIIPTQKGDSILLFGLDDSLPCHKSMLISLSAVGQGGVLLRFFAEDNTYRRSRYLLTESAIRIPKIPSGKELKIEASLTSAYEMHFSLLFGEGDSLASIHYSINGLVRVESEGIACINPNISKIWLPKSLTSVAEPLPAANDDGAEPCQAANKRPRHD